MGFLWDVLQQSQISSTDAKVAGHEQHIAAVAQRVAGLEAELHRTQQVLGQLLKWLEKKHGVDIDGDGRIG
ncbi:MAG: hypothetical protein AAF721_24130 [Myxococcota bacterium]